MTDGDVAARVERARRLATLLDGRWRLPGTRWRFGVDALLGLMPVAGDLAGALLGMGIVWHARKAAAPTSLQLRMLGNVGADFVLGSIPIVGDIADVVLKKNQRNAALLEEWAASRSPAPRRAPPGSASNRRR